MTFVAANSIFDQRTSIIIRFIMGMLILRNIFFSFLMLIFTDSHAQQPQLTGSWKGHLSQEDKSFLFDMELILMQKGNQLSGTASYDDGNGSFVKFSIRGSINKNRFSLADVFVIEESSSLSWHWCKKIYNGTITTTSNKWVMEGSWRNDQRNMFSKKKPVSNSNLSCAPGTFRVILKKEQEPPNKMIGIIAKLPLITDTVSILKQDNLFKNRIIKEKTRIEVFADSIDLNFYDNGDIDGDTISVYYNKKLIIDKQLLNASPLTVRVAVNQGSENEIIMFAENVGTIPPNTAILIFNTRNGRIEIPVDADLKSNGAVYLFRE